MSEDPNSVREHLRQKVEEAKGNIRHSNLGDVLSDEARRYKRALLALSMVGYIVSTYHIDLKEIPWLLIPAPEDSQRAVPTLVLVALGYHLIAYTFHAWADLRRWMLIQSGSQWAGQANTLFVLNQHLNTLTHAINNATGIGHTAVVEQAIKTRDAALLIADEAIRQFGSLRRQVIRVHWLKRVVAWGWDFVLPLAAADWAIYLVIDNFPTP